MIETRGGDLSGAERFVEPAAGPWRSLLGPLWFAALAIGLAWLLGGIDIPSAIAYGGLLFVAVQELRGALSSVRELTVRREGLTAINPFGRRSDILWADLCRIETVDRGRAHPRRLIRVITQDGQQFFVSDRLQRFDRAFELIRKSASDAVIRPMPLPDKLWWLQWGA